MTTGTTGENGLPSVTKPTTTTATGKIQTYECRLRRGKVLRVSDIGGETEVRNEAQLVIVARALTKNVPHEQVWVILLGAQLDVRGAVRVGEGGLHGCALKPSDVLRVVLLSGCSCFALSHNHPSGDPTPSVADWEMTRALRQASEVCGLTLVDHVIVTQGTAHRTMAWEAGWE